MDENLRRLLTAGSSLGGARPKAATEIDGQAWLAKFPMTTDTAPLCRVEAATMALAADCGLDVPPVGLRRAFDRDIYLIRRFDRPVGDGDVVSRTPFASGLTLLGAHERDVGRHSYADLADALRRFGADPRRDLAELFARMVFNILVTNDDDHLRNHGFLWTAKGWRLSPLYDVVPKPQLSLERILVLGVGPLGRAATLENALAGAAAFALAPDRAQAVIARLQGMVSRAWETAFADAGIGLADRSRFATCFRLSAAKPATGPEIA